MNRGDLQRKYGDQIDIAGDAVHFCPGDEPLELGDFIDFSLIDFKTRQGYPAQLRIQGRSNDTAIIVHAPAEVEVDGELDSVLTIDTGAQVQEPVHLSGGVFHDVVLASGNVTASGPETVRKLSADTDLTLSFNVDELLQRRANLTVTLKHSVGIKKLSCTDCAPDARPTLTFRKLEGKAGNEEHVGITTVDGPGRLHLDRVEVSITENKHPLTVTGNGVLVVPASMTLTDVTIQGDPAMWPSLDLRSAASIRDFKGVCKIKNAVGAAIIAPHGGAFDYLGVHSTDRIDDPLQNSTIRGARIEPGNTGRVRVAELAGVRVFEPAFDKSSHPDGWWTPFYSLHQLEKLSKNAPGKRAEKEHLLDCAYFYKELDVLVAEKCGAGAIRSKVAWDRVRAQHLISGRVERWMYAGFRLLGYGQRPLPPLLTWLVMGFVTALIAQWMSLSDVHAYTGGFLPLWIHVLFTPFVLLRFASETQVADYDFLAGLGPLQRQMILLLQVLVVAAFGFFLVGLRNYLRSGLPQ